MAERPFSKNPPKRLNNRLVPEERADLFGGSPGSGLVGVSVDRGCERCGSVPHLVSDRRQVCSDGEELGAVPMPGVVQAHVSGHQALADRSPRVLRPEPGVADALEQADSIESHVLSQLLDSVTAGGNFVHGNRVRVREHLGRPSQRRLARVATPLHSTFWPSTLRPAIPPDVRS